jgi:hypothetical protein
MKKNRGFSVAELLAIIVIMAILIVSGVSVSRSILPRSYLATAINTFSADFSYARQLASKENRYIAFVFNSEGTAYTLYRQKLVGDNTQWDPIEKKINIKPMKGRKFFETATDFVVGSMGEVRDYPNCGSNTTITLDFFISKGDVNFKNQIKIYEHGGIKVGKIKKM